MKDNVYHWLYIQWMFPVSFFAVLNKELWNLSQFILKFFTVIRTTKTTAILGALHAFTCPLLWEWRINLYRTQSHLVWVSTLRYKCRLNWGENVDKSAAATWKEQTFCRARNFLRNKKVLVNYCLGTAENISLHSCWVFLTLKSLTESSSGFMNDHSAIFSPNI